MARVRLFQIQRESSREAMLRQEDTTLGTGKDTLKVNCAIMDGK